MQIRKNICLNMIVKNETGVLPRLLSSVHQYIDYYVIVDTGSNDGTQKLIKKSMDGYGIPGEIHDRPWVNFGVNRQQALELAVQADKTEWLLFVDADEELEVTDPNFFTKLKSGTSYEIAKHHAEIRYFLPNLINIKHAKWQWLGPVHNYLQHLEGVEERVQIKDIWIIYHPGEGAKSHGLTTEEKYLKDAKILEEDLIQNPDSARSQFYLGQSYKNAGHLEKALCAYQNRAGMQGWDEENFMAQLEVGRVGIALEKSENFIETELLKAHEMRPSRAEPLHELARYFRLKEEYSKANQYARKGLKLDCPDDRLFIEHEVYEWRLLDEAALSAYWISEYQQSMADYQTILSQHENNDIKLPATDLDRIRTNIAFAEEKINPVARQLTLPKALRRAINRVRNALVT